ncbi:hypothetical protein TRV_05803 [Paecilomyces variotii No. 5]|uniref:Uncharacterized protein n=1 Tax=Byssochlamys spectabilis (strain No. 5 / NBRC 109023) TaxID=1356009 RepID=V5I3U6_BYSSN|nr:hypothetical protein TRV_05803 [Paecilomyces variotii No. 5]
MGKVHGSLARAGKVKSATPKVEKQEKKKVPKGRAKKRLLYTRRFVNVTMTGGKRKVCLDISLHVDERGVKVFRIGHAMRRRAPGLLPLRR